MFTKSSRAIKRVCWF